MATHDAVIFKAAFAACLLRPDPTSVPRDEISSFHISLERALSHCSPSNIQTCKAWLLQFVAFSSNRVGGLVNYLEALAASFPSQPTGSKLSPKRQRLHILYLLNDLLHHCKYHLGTPTTLSTVSGSLQLHLVNLVGYAATCDRQKNPRHHRRLDDLLDIWSEHEYFHPDLVDKLREVVTMGVPMDSNDAANGLNSTKKSRKNVPFVMPSTHGDPSTPWHEVRAGNIYPHIIPNSTIPIRPDATKPIQLLAGPADAKSVEALQAFLSDVDKLFDPEAPADDSHTYLDQLGQTVIRGENTGDILDGTHYHGWSLEFCQPADTETDDSRGRSRSRSESRIDNKRGRYSDSSISQSESRSRSGPRTYRRDIHRRDVSNSRPAQRSRSRESSYTPREPSTSHFPPPHQPQHPPAPFNSFPTTHAPSGQYSHPPMGPNTGYPQVPAPNYGSWPPPPPHMPTMPFPPPGPGSSSAFPPPYHHPPPMPHGQNQGQNQGQRQGYGMPPGQYHFPPPYSGGQQGAPWGPPPPPQGGRGW
ncbi:RNA polymerase II, large subunit, CTD [Penicillium expansum]|uniref:RNA polymerase II, large subunit, CTD n=1 Tax=Penicillium expansum TaxID=27334 RepID=A0A0A2JPK8_PENEN|nr:RNA polymerase II, large subunit, CTD [Penicillium expansum]KGO57377.1 RNA polymerase II, large subunit, CTD [Penicillium expansum]